MQTLLACAESFSLDGPLLGRLMDLFLPLFKKYEVKNVPFCVRCAACLNSALKFSGNAPASPVWLQQLTQLFGRYRN